MPAIKALLAIVVVLLPFGSIEDRVGVVTVWLVVQVPAVAPYLNAFRNRFTNGTLRCVLLSIICIVWAWANARFRTGDGPFHIAGGPSSGAWRGYPFELEEWIWAFNPHGTVWHEWRLLGLLADLSLLIVAWLWIRRRFPVSQFHPLPALMALCSGLFAWLNIEPWLLGVPVSFIGSHPAILSTVSKVKVGFPWTYLHADDTAWHVWRLVANVAVGCVSWTVLFVVSQLKMIADEPPNQDR